MQTNEQTIAYRKFDEEFAERNHAHKIRWWRARLLDALAGAAEQDDGNLLHEVFDELLGNEIYHGEDISPEDVCEIVITYLEENEWKSCTNQQKQ